MRSAATELGNEGDEIRAQQILVVGGGFAGPQLLRGERVTIADMSATTRLYLQDDHCCEADATIVAVQQSSVACDRTCFYPGGGGQPSDEGAVMLPNGERLEIVSAHAGADEIVWHASQPPPAPEIVGQRVRLTVNRTRRMALARYHTVLHVLNTIVLRDYGGWITGAHIDTDYSRIDFKIEGFSSAIRSELERKVNAILEANYTLGSYYMPEAEFRTRDDLLRTLEVKPPVCDGQVRVVEIQGFDAQACGGTHVRTTAEVGRFSIVRTENKGKINKRLYVRLEQPISLKDGAET